MNNHIVTAIDALLDDQEQRHSWLFEAGEKIRRWKEEELANAASQHRAGAPSGLSPSVSGKAAHRISQGDNNNG